jgi:hypothetical protein
MRLSLVREDRKGLLSSRSWRFYVAGVHFLSAQSEKKLRPLPSSSCAKWQNGVKTIEDKTIEKRHETIILPTIIFDMVALVNDAVPVDFGVPRRGQIC